VQGAGSTVQGSGFRVQGSGFRREKGREKEREWVREKEGDLGGHILERKHATVALLPRDPAARRPEPLVHEPTHMMCLLKAYKPI